MMSKYIALWEEKNGAPCFHIVPVEAENYQALLDDAEKNRKTVLSIFDATDKTKEPKQVYSH